MPIESINPALEKETTFHIRSLRPLSIFIFPATQSVWVCRPCGLVVKVKPTPITFHPYKKSLIIIFSLYN